jgi:hypothetical protein
MSDDCARQESPRRFERLFIVRLWSEAGSSLTSAFRGSVVDVASGKRFFFSSLAALNDFLYLRVHDHDDTQGRR